MNLEELKREWITKQYGTKACDCPTCVAYITALEAECERLRELHVMQLAGIMTASLQNTEATIKDRIGKDNPYWTQAYEDVCVAVDREVKHRAECERLRGLLDKIGNLEPCTHEGRCFYPMHDMDGSYMGEQDVDPICVIQQMAELSKAKEGK